MVMIMTNEQSKWNTSVCTYDKIKLTFPERIVKLFGGVTQQAHDKAISLDRQSLKISRNRLTEWISRFFPHDDLQNFRHYVSRQESIRKFHIAIRDGERKPHRLSTYAKMTKEEEDLFCDYANEYILKGTNTGFISDMYRISNYIDNFSFHYKKETQDIWSSPEALYVQLDNGRIIDDCDGIALLKWYLMSSLISERYLDEAWRLRICWVNFRGHKNEGHLNLAIVKETDNHDLIDWVFIESTLWQEYNYIFKNNPVRFQNNYTVLWSFNDKTEYEGLYE